MPKDATTDSLPEGWQRCRLPEFVGLEMGQSPPSRTYNDTGDGLPFFQGKAEFGELYPSIEKYCSEPKKIARSGATLLSVRAPVGPTNLAPEKCCIGRGLAALHPEGGIDPKFVLYLFRAMEPKLSSAGTGSTFKAISKSFLYSLEVDLPPLPEQNRIVAKLEELLSELDKGVESLKTARTQLEVYRQALLKHAFEGRLTGRWRGKNADKLEGSDQLRHRIKRERDARYQEQFAKWKQATQEWEAAGKPGRRPPRPKRRPPIESVSESGASDLPQLPAGWHWVPLSWLLSLTRKPMTTGPFGTMLKKSEHQRDGVPVLGIENISRGVFVPGNKIFVTADKADDLVSFEVSPGDVVISRSGTVGEICEIPSGLGTALISTNLLRVSLNPNVVLGSFFVWMFQGGGSVRQQVKDLCKGSSREFLNQSILKRIMFPLCGLAEQREIVQTIDEMMSSVSQAEHEIGRQLRRAGTLRAAILMRAFSGRLLEQDPNDEPASALLDRIATERDAQGNKQQKRAVS